MINSTKNYDIFKKQEANRRIREDHVARLIGSIEIKNLLPLRPILVNANMEVIDGQHRLEAAKRMETPIYFMMEKSMEVNDIVLLNANQMSWKAEDYMNHYCKMGSEQYLNLNKFLQESNMTLGDFMVITKDWLANGNQFTRLFKTGLFKMPSLEVQKKMSSLWDSYRELCVFLKQRRSDISDIVNSTYFLRALIPFLKRVDVIFEILKERLELRIDFIGKRSGQGSYYLMLLEIYNYKSRNPIPYHTE